jgi:hypothetical protein
MIFSTYEGKANLWLLRLQEQDYLHLLGAFQHPNPRMCLVWLL